MSEAAFAPMSVCSSCINLESRVMMVQEKRLVDSHLVSVLMRAVLRLDMELSRTIFGRADPEQRERMDIGPVINGFQPGIKRSCLR
mgnify:FL=1